MMLDCRIVEAALAAWRGDLGPAADWLRLLGATVESCVPARS